MTDFTWEAEKSTLARKGLHKGSLNTISSHSPGHLQKARRRKTGLPQHKALKSVGRCQMYQGLKKGQILFYYLASSQIKTLKLRILGAWLTQSRAGKQYCFMLECTGQKNHHRLTGRDNLRPKGTTQPTFSVTMLEVQILEHFIPSPLSSCHLCDVGIPRKNGRTPVQHILKGKQGLNSSLQIEGSQRTRREKKL